MCVAHDNSDGEPNGLVGGFHVGLDHKPFELVGALVPLVESNKERVPVTQLTGDIAEVVSVREVFEEQIVDVPVPLIKEDIVQVTRPVPFEPTQTRIVAIPVP